ncbi:unnamed protein product [Trichobilharzia szidati]|nr:unnamed protein product [Trichobilharzia szidati]
MIRNIGDNASRNSVHNKNMTNSIKIDDEISREKNASIQKVSLTQCTSMLDNDKLHPKPNKLTVTTFESTAFQNESLMTLSQHTKENRKTHQTTTVHTPNLNVLTPERLNKNCVKTDDSFELALIPLSLCHSSNTPENLCLPQLSSNTSEIQLSTPHPVTVLNNKCLKYLTEEEHSGNTCCSPTQSVEYNNSLSAAPSSLVSSAMATSSDVQNYRSKNSETEYYHHLDSLTPTQSPTTTTAVTKTAVMTTLTTSQPNKHIYNLDSRDMSNHASMSQNDHLITNEESVQPVDRALSNHSTFNDHRSNLLTSSECLSSSLENQKVDDFVANAITNNGNNNNNNNMGSNSDFTNHRDFPLRSRSFFHLRRLDSPNSIGSNSTKPATDILSSPYDYSSSTNQLTVRVSSSPVSICRGDRHSHYHNYHRWQQQQQQHSCTSNTTNNSNNSSSAVKNKHGKCDKHISSGKSIGVRSYSAMRHPNGCDTRVFRSPLDVLAPCKGKLRVDIEYQCNSIKLHVIEAKGLRAANNQMCNSFVKVNVTPDKENSYEQISETIENSTTPYYNKEFSLDLNKIKYGRRIYFAIYVISHDKTESEFVGGMSFGIASIQNKKHISGWYYLLDEKMYRKKHLKTALDPAANNLENTLCANNEQLTAHTCHTTNTPSSEVISAKPTTPTSASVVSVAGSTINQEPIWWNYSNYQHPMNNELNKTVSNELHLVETSDTVHTNNNNSNNNNNNNNGNGVMNDSFCKQLHTVVTPANFMIYSQNLPNTTLSYPPVISSEINAYLSQMSSPPVSTRVNMSIPNTNKALSNMRIFQFIIQKGSKGFGFTLCGNCPVYVSHVEPGSPAMKCGIQAGDFIVAIDNLNVSRSTSDSVVRMFRMSQHPVHITISRPVIMKSNLSTLNNAPSTSGKSLSSFINKSCFSALKKSSSESTKLTQLTNILNLNQTVSPPSPGNPQHHYYYQQHQPLQLEATSLSSTTTPLQNCCPSIDQSAVRLSGCLTSPNLLRQSNSLNCSSSMSNINNNCTTGEFTASQTTSPLHQTMTNKCFVRTDLNNLQTDLQLASTLSYPPLSSIPVYHFHQKQQQNPFHGQLQQQQQRQQLQKKVNSPSKVTESETSCSDKAQNEQKSIGQSIQNREHLTDPKCLLQHNQHTDTMDKSEFHQIQHFLPQNENLPGNTSLYNVSTAEQSGYPTPHHHHHHLLQQHHHHPQQQQMLMTMMMTATTTFPGINQYYYSNQSTGYLEHHGWLNLLDTCGWKKVELLLFPDLLLIAQKNSSGYFNVIKDPIYNTKISYINIPPYASDQLILQYLTEDNRKQIAHFQGSDVHEWLVRIQRHMVYNGNWWMGGK